MKKVRVNKNKRLVVMLTPEIHDQVSEIAYKKDISASSWARRLIINAIESEGK